MDFRSPDKDKVPQGLKVIDVIKYPNNEVAFYLITKNTKNEKISNLSKPRSVSSGYFSNLKRDTSPKLVIFGSFQGADA